MSIKGPELGNQTHCCLVILLNYEHKTVKDIKQLQLVSSFDRLTAFQRISEIEH